MPSRLPHEAQGWRGGGTAIRLPTSGQGQGPARPLPQHKAGRSVRADEAESDGRGRPRSDAGDLRQDQRNWRHRASRHCARHTASQAAVLDAKRGMARARISGERKSRGQSSGGVLGGNTFCMSTSRRGTSPRTEPGPREGSWSSIGAPRPTRSRVTTEDGRSPGSRVAALPHLPSTSPCQWSLEEGLAAYSCGGSRSVGHMSTRTAFPFDPSREPSRLRYGRPGQWSTPVGLPGSLWTSSRSLAFALFRRTHRDAADATKIRRCSPMPQHRTWVWGWFRDEGADAHLWPVSRPISRPTTGGIVVQARLASVRV